MESRSLSSRTPKDAETSSLIVKTTQDHAETSSSIEPDYEKWKTEMMKKPQIMHICYIMQLDMLLLNLIKLNTGMLKTESNQNQLKQLVELIKMNVNLLIHEPGLLQSMSKLDLEELYGFVAASHNTDQASTQRDDPVKKIKEIYDLLEKAKANAGQFELGQDLIEAIRNLIQQYQEEFQGEHQVAPAGSNIDPNKLNNDVAEHIVNLLPVELRPALAKSNLFLVKGNLEQMNQILILLKQKSFESNSNQIELKKLINVTSNLINQISRVDCRLSNPQADSNWEEIMKSHATRIIQLMCSPKAELYIDQMDSFKDICNQVAAMYKHSQTIQQSERRTDDTYTWCRSFHKDIFHDNCEGVKKFLKEHPLALTAKITVDGNTALHVAVKAQKRKIVEMLLEKLREENKLVETLKKQNKEGKTALYIAASSGFPKIAKELVKTNKDILLIECEDGTNHMFPLFVAAKYDNKDMVEYIYDEMQKYKKEKESSSEDKKLECFPINQNDQKAKVWMRKWASFLANLIYNDHYDMALRIINDYPSLGLSKCTDVETPLFALAQRPSLGANVTFHGKTSKFQCPTFICGKKTNDGIASKASELLEKIILTIDDLESQKPALSAAFFKAAEVGSVEFVAMFINSLPLALSWLNDLHQNIFHVAIINRQENIFNLIYGLGSVKNDLTGSADKFNNWMLHLAGEMAPAYRLNQVPGPAMQLQRELQWFQAVKEIVPNISIEVKNLGIKSMTPHELFAEEHKDLIKDGQDWMRNTASSCSIVATLITTVMFAAAFTLPGGNNQNTGYPMFLGDISFLLFAVADLVALSTSCTSVLIFLAILTSRFAQDDFLESLPMRLFYGLVLLFVSMAAMMLAFCDTIYIIIQNQYHWFCIPIIVLVGFIPVVIFLWMMFPLLINLGLATYSSIFDKNSRALYY